MFSDDDGAPSSLLWLIFILRSRPQIWDVMVTATYFEPILISEPPADKKSYSEQISKAEESLD